MARTWQPQKHDRCWDNLLVALYCLDRDDGEAGAHLSTLVSELELSTRTARALVDSLERALIVRMDSRDRVSLTATGRHVAAAIVRRHRIVECFLADTLGLPAEACHEEAERLQRAISGLVEDRMFQFLGRPERCPHGEVIPPPLAGPPSEEPGSSAQQPGRQADGHDSAGPVTHEYRWGPAVAGERRREGALAARISTHPIPAR